MGIVARIERSEMRDQPFPDVAEFTIGPARGWTRWVHPGYRLTVMLHLDGEGRGALPTRPGLGVTAMAQIDLIREARRRLATDGPTHVRSDGDFGTVTLPETDCDAVRDLLIADYWWPSVATAVRYFETNLGWAPIPLAGGTARGGCARCGFPIR